MLRSLTLLVAAAGLLSAAPMTYTLTGTGTGSWNSQAFTNAAFTITFTSDTTTIVHGTSCCGNTDSTPSGTAATVNVSGFASAQLTGDQAIFMDHGGETAGIWHFNTAQYLTVTNRAFATDDLTTTIAPNSVSGTAWSYMTPLSLSTGGTLYFSSVQNVFYSQQPGNAGGEPYTISVAPNSGTQMANTTQTYTFVVGDTGGAGDIGGVDIQFRDKPTYPNACWLFFNASNSTIAVNNQGNWSALVPIGAGGSTLTGDACTVDTTALTVSTSGNNLTLTAPIQLTVADNNTWQIFVDTQSKENVDATYSQLGTVTVKSAPPQFFNISVSPSAPQAAPTGGSVSYTVTAAAQNGFNEPITFSGASKPSTSGNTTQLSFAFNPPTVQASGTTTMTVSSPSSATPDNYTLTVTGTSQSLTETQSVSLELENGPPALTLMPTSGAGSSQTFTITWQDTTDVSTLNLLIAPSLNGQNACWLYFDPHGEGPDGKSIQLYLASDDGSSWMDAGSTNTQYGGPTPTPPTSNSQCSVVASNAKYDYDTGFGNGIKTGHNTLTIPITFTAAFDGAKTVYVDGNNQAGFSSGYLPKGMWTVQ